MDAEGKEVETLIEDWNASRVDIFAISKPNDNLDFSGVMRFYFQEPGAKDRKVATKCIRVNSSHTSDEVIKILVEKFHPDLKMLTMPHYSLYEVHETGTDVRKLDLDEKPLYVQLYWQQSDRDGRFLLKNEDDQMTTQSLFDPSEQNFKRRLSKREKKEMKKKRRMQAKQAYTENSGSEIAKQLYDDRPTSGLTRSLSNPEAVMRKRREIRLLKKMEQYEDTETNPGGGGPLRIFAESLQPEIPYKTLLFSNNHTTEYVLKTALEKYEVPPEEMDMYCLTMVTIYPGNGSEVESVEIKERVVHDDDCPLAIASSWPEANGELRFYIKKKENMPKSKRPAPKKTKDPQISPPKNEASPVPITETTFDITDVSPNEKELVSSPPVHVVESAHDLPATLEFLESGEDAFFAVVVSEVNGTAVHFKLAPTYTLYMCCRYRLSPKFRPDFPANKRREKVAMTAKKVANMMWQTVKENTTMAGHLAFWMANSSEFLHFLKQDADFSTMTEDSQKILAHTTQQAFRSLVQCIKAELQGCLPAFLDPSDETDFEEEENDSMEGEQFDPNEGYLSTERSFRVKNFSPNGQPIGGDQWMGKRKKASRPVLGDVLHTLSSAMSLLRRCRVNAALTIQLFSQLFHYINMYIFNRLVLEPQLKLCTRAWGVRLMQRLARIQDWAENLGLELAAECHLGRASQAAFLLQVPKQDSTAISSHCYKLNSLQLRQLLELYEPDRDEQEIPLELINNAVAVAENTADSLAHGEGQEVRLEEDPELHLPFLLPEDGYSSEQIRGVPPGLREFLEPMIKPDLCRLTIQPKASGLWTVHFKPLGGPESHSPEPSPPKELTKITINKGNKGMGVSIVGAKGVDQDQSGIYVKEIVKGGPAFLDGRLKPGDQILEVNGEPLVGIAQEDAVKLLMKVGSVVHMTCSKGAVWQHGLALLLKQPAVTNKVESPSRNPEAQNDMPAQKKEMPRAPPRYRAQQDLATTAAPRSPSLHTSHLSEQPSSPKLLGQPKPEPRQRRRSPYENEYKDWKNQVQHDGGPEQATIPAKTVVEYKVDDVSVGQKLYKGAVPYANPQEIQKRQKEMQERKMVEERREQENMERERIRGEEEERQERERQEHERINREELARREERERIQHEELEQQERRDRERIDREQQERRERERIDREQQERRERERIDQERREREKIDREQQERRERERIDQERRERERIDREQQERREREKIDRERERIDREQQERRERERNDELERKKREEWEKKDRERIQREEMERKQREQLDDLSREEREFEMKLEQKRREKEKRLQELRRQLEEEEAEAERIEREYRERMKKRDERMDQQRNPVAKEPPKTVAKEPPRPPVAKEPPRPPVAKEPPRPPAVQNTQVHYINDQGKGREMEETKARAEESRPARRVDYEKRQQSPNDSMDIDPVEVERQFQQRLAQETRNDEPDGGFITVIRVPVQQETWDQEDGEYMENTRKRMERVEIEGANGDTRARPETDLEDRPRARVDWQKSEDERYRKEMQRREQDAQLMRDFQKQRTFEGEGYRKPPVGAGGEQPVYPRQPEWEKEDELRRQREEDDRLREARANQLRNRCIEQPDEDENNRNTSYTNGRTKRVKFATVRTEITQPSPDTELSKAGVKFVHDGKVADSEDEEELRRPPPPEDEDEAPPHPPPPENNTDYYQRPPPPPKPQFLRDNKTNGAPPEYPSYRDNEQFNTSQPQSRMTEQEMRYATYPGRQPHNNNYPVPKPRVPRNLDASPDQAKLPFKDKMKVFNENTPPKKQTTSRWEREQNGDLNGDTL